MFFNACVEWSGCLPNVVAATVAAEIVDYPLRLLFGCRVFPTVNLNDGFESCERVCSEVGVNACLLFE